MEEKYLYGRKVFLGGLPVAITVAEIHANFDRFGPLMVDWPHKAAYEVMPPNRYAFLIFSNPSSVNQLMSMCGPSDFNNFVIELQNGNKCLISVKPWELRHNEAILDRDWKRFERYSVFIGGVHRRATAAELAAIINDAVGGVVYVGMEIDDQTDYPKGAARVVFSNPTSYIKAIGTRRITTVTNGYERVIELKPYVCANMRCEECLIVDARFFCPEIRCLKYFCENCWPMAHGMPGMNSHFPMDKQNLHLHTPKKYNALQQRMGAGQDKPPLSPWMLSPLTPTTSLSSPMKLSPTSPQKEDFGLDQPGIDVLMALDKRLQSLRYGTPTKQPPQQLGNDFPNWLPATPCSSNDKSPWKISPKSPLDKFGANAFKFDGSVTFKFD